MVDDYDVRAVTLASLRRQVGVVFEESFLFSDTVRANIAYGRSDATDEQIVAAAKAAQAHEFIEALPDGYETFVGERGLTLSGGQRQRIALARALLYNPRILILDDATSAIDANIEEAIHDALREIMADRTTVLIAHRRSTLHLADRIVVMEAGRVVDEGSHEELMAPQCPLPVFLSGLEESLAAQVGDRIEALAAISSGAGRDVVTASAWAARAWHQRGRGRQRSNAPARSIGPPSIGPGLGGGRWGMAAEPGPHPGATGTRGRPAPGAGCPGRRRRKRVCPGQAFQLAPVAERVPHAAAGRAGARGPRRPGCPGRAGAGKRGPGQRRGHGSLAVLLMVSGIYLFVVLADLVVEIGETFVTGRVAQRIMLSLRIRIGPSYNGSRSITTSGKWPAAS